MCLICCIGLFNHAFAQDPVDPQDPQDQQIPVETSDMQQNRVQPDKKGRAQKAAKSKTKRSGGMMDSFRGLLSQVSLSVSTGYGATFNSHDLKGFGVFQPAQGSGVYLFDEAYADRDTLPVIYTDWVNNPSGIGGLIIPVDSLSQPIITNGIPVFPNDIKFGYDSINIGYKSTSSSVPITLKLSIDVDRYRIGGGMTMEFQRFSAYRPTALTEELRKFKTSFTAATYKRYFGFIGITTYESWRHKMLADIEFGKINRGKNYNKSLMSSGIYFNFGYTIERNLSEYFKVFVRPSFEWKSYSLSIAETGLQINHRQPALYIKFGASIRMPRLRRCPVKGCKSQINHVHGDKEYRSKVHPIWKWQNPNYGQNNPVPLWKKGKY